MKKLIILAFAAAIGIYACKEATKSTEEETGIYNAFCYNGDSTSALCSTLPPEVAIAMMGDYHTDSTPTAQFQPPFDAFSWQTL